MPTIVFGDDRSPGADVAWLWLNDQVWPGWTVELVEVPEDEAHIGPLTEDPTWSSWVPEAPRAVFTGSELTARSVLGTGDPRRVLAEREGADLLVVGPTGSGLAKRWLHLGSTTEWLLHEPPVPMVIARSAGPVRQVVAAVDGSGPAERAVAALAALPWSGGLQVHVVGVYDGWSEPAVGIESAVAVLDDAGIVNTSEEVRGRATEMLQRAIDRRRPQLIVLGSKGKSTFTRIVAGSTAGAIARGATCNVLLTA